MKVPHKASVCERNRKILFTLMFPFVLVCLAVALSACGDRAMFYREIFISCQKGEASVCTRLSGGSCVAWRTCP